MENVPFLGIVHYCALDRNFCCFYIRLGTTENIPNELTKRNKIVLWVPAHIGIFGSEETDMPAKEGTPTYPMGPGQILGISRSQIISDINELLNQ